MTENLNIGDVTIDSTARSIPSGGPTVPPSWGLIVRSDTILLERRHLGLKQVELDLVQEIRALRKDRAPRKIQTTFIRSASGVNFLKPRMECKFIARLFFH